jgi:hypothetical protein
MTGRGVLSKELSNKLMPSSYTSFSCEMIVDTSFTISQHTHVERITGNTVEPNWAIELLVFNVLHLDIREIYFVRLSSSISIILLV